ncbi:MAG: retroviral-like aspartic protease family protein [Chloroflexi bacterium]|nr:retroviral-like aspartic protease family protein [Chloroflexota bacterium]
MGTFTVNIQVGDEQGQTFEEVEALVDSGATFTVIPASTLRRLGVEPRRRVPFRLANDEVEQRDVGVAVVRFDGHESITSVVFGEEGTVLLGALTMEDMLLAIDVINKRLVPVEALMVPYGVSSAIS